jgi:mannose-6-phosphate isomerase
VDAAQPARLTQLVQRLSNQVQPYAWGSRTALPALLGLPETGGPQAELWLGAHPIAPSRTESGAGLDAFLAAAPEARLGAATVARFGPRLPYLLKVLAAAEPLSLQAHPSLAQARAGFAREEAAGVPLTAPHRSYKDPNHKPELLCALTPFTALCGFRRVEDTVRFFAALGLDTARLRGEGLGGWFAWVLRERPGLELERALAGARAGVEGFEPECALAGRLAAAYPGDVGLLGALALNLVTLAPGEALYLDAGNLHAYIEGVGVELMANSDNVLRGGLTPKHVDVTELLSVLDFRDGPAQVLRPTGSPEAVYETPAADFRLSRLELRGDYAPPRRGPELYLVTAGTATARAGAEARALARGDSLFVAADDGLVTFSGEATLFRATPGAWP